MIRESLDNLDPFIIIEYIEYEYDLINTLNTLGILDNK